MTLRLSTNGLVLEFLPVDLQSVTGRVETMRMVWKSGARQFKRLVEGFTRSSNVLHLT
jgi:hypothetical protein